MKKNGQVSKNNNNKMAKQAAEQKLSCFPIYQYYKIKSKNKHSAGKTITITLVFKNKKPL
jgi:hypothetical protein